MFVHIQVLILINIWRVNLLNLIYASVSKSSAYLIVRKANLGEMSV